MSAKDLLRELGPVDEWLIPASEIEHIIRTGHCAHLLPRIDACHECFVNALMDRQTELLVLRLGYPAEDAKATAASLMEKHRRGAAS